MSATSRSPGVLSQGQHLLGDLRDGRQGVVGVQARSSPRDRISPATDAESRTARGRCRADVQRTPSLPVHLDVRLVALAAATTRKRRKMADVPRCARQSKTITAAGLSTTMAAPAASVDQAPAAATPSATAAGDHDSWTVVNRLSGDHPNHPGECRPAHAIIRRRPVIPVARTAKTTPSRDAAARGEVHGCQGTDLRCDDPASSKLYVHEAKETRAKNRPTTGRLRGRRRRRRRIGPATGSGSSRAPARNTSPRTFAALDEARRRIGCPGAPRPYNVATTIQGAKEHRAAAARPVPRPRGRHRRPFHNGVTATAARGEHQGWPMPMWTDGSSRAGSAGREDDTRHARRGWDGGAPGHRRGDREDVLSGAAPRPPLSDTLQWPRRIQGIRRRPLPRLRRDGGRASRHPHCGSRVGRNDSASITLALSVAGFLQLLLDTTVEEAVVKYGFRYVATEQSGACAGSFASGSWSVGRRRRGNARDPCADAVPSATCSGSRADNRRSWWRRSFRWPRRRRASPAPR